MLRRTTSAHDRFWAKVNKNGPVPTHVPELGPCWIWTAYRIRGYGEFQRGRRGEGLVLAHRFAWEEVHGPIDASLEILHRCDNRSCVRLDHLFLGSQSDNMRDMVAKGRSQRGEEHWRAVLTDEAIAAIRADAENGVTQRELARRHGIDQSTISFIVQRKSWSHV